MNLINPKTPNSHCQASRLVRSRRQSGISMFGLLMLLVLLAVVMNVGLTLGPHYMDNRSINNVIQNINPSIWNSGSKKKLHAAVNKGLKVNNVRGLKSEDIIKIEKKGSTPQVTLDYEVRENLISNLDAVLVFKKDYTR